MLPSTGTTRYSRAEGEELLRYASTCGADVIHAGNAIAGLPGGNERRTCMTRLVECLRTALTTTAPLAVSGVA